METTLEKTKSDNGYLDKSIQEAHLELVDVKTRKLVHDTISAMIGADLLPGVHYMEIKKGNAVNRVLMKAGAEFIAKTFQLVISAIDVTTERLDNNHIDVTINTHLAHEITGKNMGVGLGSCSTLEPNFCTAFGKPVSANELPTKWNSVKKIGKKRSFVDAVITATGTSDILTQDLDDSGQFPQGKQEYSQPKQGFNDNVPPCPANSHHNVMPNQMDGADWYCRDCKAQFEEGLEQPVIIPTKIDQRGNPIEDSPPLDDSDYQRAMQMHNNNRLLIPIKIGQEVHNEPISHK